jgi:hypothetical protein
MKTRVASLSDPQPTSLYDAVSERLGHECGTTFAADSTRRRVRVGECRVIGDTADMSAKEQVILDSVVT